MFLRIFFSYRGVHDQTIELVSCIEKKIKTAFLHHDSSEVSFYNYQQKYKESDNRLIRDDLIACNVANVLVMFSCNKYFPSNEELANSGYTNTMKEFEVFRGNDMSFNNNENIQGNKVSYKVLFNIPPHPQRKNELKNYIQNSNYEGNWSEYHNYPSYKKHLQEEYMELGVVEPHSKHPFVEGVSLELFKFCEGVLKEMHKKENLRKHTYITIPEIDNDTKNNPFTSLSMNSLFFRDRNSYNGDHENVSDVIICPKFLFFHPRNIYFRNDNDDEKFLNKVYKEYCDKVEELYYENSKKLIFLIHDQVAHINTTITEYNKVKSSNKLIIYIGVDENKTKEFNTAIKELLEKNPNDTTVFFDYRKRKNYNYKDNSLKLDNREEEAINKIIKIVTENTSN